MTVTRSRVLWAIGSTLASLGTAVLAFRVGEHETFGNEWGTELLGVVSFLFALLASVLLYPLRTGFGTRLFLGFTVLLTVLFGFEFVGGMVWFLLDKIAHYEQGR